MEQILTIKQVSDFLQVNERTIYKLAKCGELPSFKVGGQWRFRKADIDGWIEGKKVQAG